MEAARLHKLARELSAVVLAATRESGEPAVPVSTVAVVEDLSRHGPTTVGEIARRTGVAQSQVSDLVAELSAAGLVLRRADSADRRRRLLTVSARGRALLTGRGARGVSAALAERHPDQSAAALARTERLIEELADRLLGHD